jgi:hypothetical protein
VDKVPSDVRPQSPPERGRAWVRRQIIIDPPFQYRMLIPLAVFAAIQTLFLGVLLFYPLHQSTERAPTQLEQAILYDQLLNLHVSFWTTLAITAALTAFFTLYRSNRVAGPLYKLRQGLGRISEGDFQVIRFRSGDELRDFEPVTNRLSQRMEALSTGNSRRMTKLEGRLKWLKARVDMQQLPSAEVSREIELILTELGRIEFLRERE